VEYPEDQIEELKSLSSEVKPGQEGGTTFFLMPSVKMPDGCEPAVTDLLLCPSPRDGYNSRLFFAERVRSKNNPNWRDPVRILERNWQVYSWRLNRTDLRLAQLVTAHLRALR
jgi:hypothetical protein